MLSCYEFSSLELLFALLSFGNAIGLEYLSQRCLAGEEPLVFRWALIVATQFLIEVLGLSTMRSYLIAKVRYAFAVGEMDYKSNLPLSKTSDTSKMEKYTNKVSCAITALNSFLFRIESVVGPCLTATYFFFQLAWATPFILPLPLVGVAIFHGSFWLVPEWKTTEYSVWDKLWENLWGVRNSFHDEHLHSKGNKSCQDELAGIKALDDEDAKNDLARNMETARVMISAFMVLIPIVALSQEGVPPLVFVKNFTIFITLITSTSGLLIGWKTFKRENNLLKEVKNEFGEPEEVVPDVKVDGDLVIDSLSYSNGKGFNLRLSDPIAFKKGKAYLLNGASGNGKSTFCDIVGGVYATASYAFKAMVYNHELLTFKCFNKCRIYITQDQQLNTNQTIAKMVSGFDKVDTFVLEALRLAQCADFCQLDDCLNGKKFLTEGSYNKKSLTEENPGLSGGQKARVCLARGIYRALKMTDIKMVILDEIDRAVSSEMCLTMMNDILKYFCEERGAIVLVCAHTDKVKTAKWWEDKIFFNQGVVSYEDIV